MMNADSIAGIRGQLTSRFETAVKQMQFTKYWLAVLTSLNGLSMSIAVDTKSPQQSSEDSVKFEARAAEETPATAEQIGEWITNLSSDSFKLRRESFVQLWRAGKPALQAVQAAMLSTEQQQAETAATLEVLIRLDVAVDDPSEAADLLSELSTAPELALIKLCKRGYWNVAEQFLDLNAELLNNFRSSASAYTRMNALVDEALEQGQLELAWPVIRKVLPYQQALWIATKQGLEPPKLDEADPTTQAWSRFVKGEYAAALATSAADTLRADLAVRSFQWEAFRQPALLAGLVGGRKAAGQAAARAVMLEFAGQLDESELIWEEILPKASAENNAETDQPAAPAENANEEGEAVDDKVPSTAQFIKTDRKVLDALAALESDPSNLDRVLLGMLLTGRTQAVQDYLLENSPENAWLLCITRGDQDAALSALGIAPDLSNYDEWLKQRRIDLHAEAAGFFSLAKFRSTVQLANNLQVLGMHAEADKAFEVLVAVCRVARQRGDEYWQTLVSNMTRAEARHRFLEIMAANYSRIDELARKRSLALLYPECAMSADVLYEVAPEIKNSNDVPSKWEALEQLYLYNRERFEPHSAKVLSGWLRRARNRLSEIDELTPSHLSELAKLADGIGQSDLALELTRESGQGGSELWAYAAQTLQNRGELKSAVEYFEAIRRLDSGRQECIIDEANALLMLGRVTEAEALQKSRWLRPLLLFGANSWFTVAQRLNEAQRFELAKEYIEPAYLLAGCDEVENMALQQPSFVGIALEYSQTADELKDVALSADIHRAMLATFLSTQKARGYPLSVYASIGAKERTRRAVLAARSGDMKAFQRHVLVAEDLQPQGIELVEDTYLDLIASGNQALADEVFARFEKRLLVHLERWPKDATSHNNLAWMCARCNLRLEEALEHAQTAVELSPHSAVLLDTLAEVQFRLNQFSAAINTTQRCIQLDPRDPHVRRQLERFLKAEIESRK